MGNKLRKIIDDAIDAVDKYKHPDLDEFIENIDPILEALGEGKCSRDKIESISIYDGYLKIDTSYSVRCCSQTGEYRCPMQIINSNNPILDAQLWKRKEEIKEAKRDILEIEKELKEAKEKLSNIIKGIKD